MGNKKIKFAHLADLHLGAYREKRLTQLNFLTFQKAVSMIIERQVDFCVFAGDIFNNSMPSIEIVMQVIDELMKLKRENIPVYIIGGSHDYSVTRKNYLELLEKAELVRNVAKMIKVGKGVLELEFTYDEKTKTSFSGVEGRRNELEKGIFEMLKTPKLDKNKFNIFLFHTGLNDFKPDSLKKLKTKMTMSHLPVGFDYYAGGHIHSPFISSSGPILSYPGALFPNNFKELCDEVPGFNFCEFNFDTREVLVSRLEIQVYDKVYFCVNVDGLNPVQAKSKIFEELEKVDFYGKIVLFEIQGIVEGKIMEIGLADIVNKMVEAGADIVLKNTYNLKSSFFEELNDLDLNPNESINHIEEVLIKKNFDLEISDVGLGDENEKKLDIALKIKLMKDLLNLDFSKQEGEKNFQHEQNIISKIDKVFFKKD